MWILSSHRMRPLSFTVRSSPSSSSGRDLRWVAYWLPVGVLASEKSSHSAPPHSVAVHMGTEGRILAAAPLGSGLRWGRAPSHSCSLFLGGKIMLFVKVIGACLTSSYKNKYSFPRTNFKQSSSSLSVSISCFFIRFLPLLGLKP